MQSISKTLMKISPARSQFMHGLLPVTAMVLTALTLAACGEKPQQAPMPKTEPAQLFQQERSALEKAKGVELNTEKGTGELRREVERQAQ